MLFHHSLHLHVWENTESQAFIARDQILGNFLWKLDIWKPCLLAQSLWSVKVLLIGCVCVCVCVCVFCWQFYLKCDVNGKWSHTLSNYFGLQPCQNVPAARNFAAFSPFLAAYSTLDFTMSPLAGKGPGVCCLLLLLCCLLLQNILIGLGLVKSFKNLGALNK